jgi:hypothetical protein
VSKIIVTHLHPDLDAIMSTWLLVRFDQSRYGDAAFAFVPAGTTYKNAPVDLDPDVVHTDVGFGRFDHHQPGAPKTCASELVYTELVEHGLVSVTDMALKRMVEHVLAIDHFQDCFWPEAAEARFAFTLSEIVPALHRLQIYDNEAVLRMTYSYLDGVYQRLKDIEKSTADIQNGEVFETVWGMTVAVVTGADDVSKVAQKMGYALVVTQDPIKGYIKLKLRPGTTPNLDVIYAKIHALEPDSWFYHNSGLMLFSGTDKGATRKPTQLTLPEVVELVKGV